MNTTKITRNGNEQGQALLATIIILAIIAVGIVIVLKGMGIEVDTNTLTQTGNNCYEAVLNSGAKELICH